MQAIKIIRMNDGIMAVLLSDDDEMARAAKFQLMRDFYERNKNNAGNINFWPTFTEYQIQNPHCWRVESYTAIATLQELESTLNPLTRDNRTHNPATTPTAGHQRMPLQHQFPRKQLPVSPIPAASMASDRSHPTPAVPREHQRVEQLSATIREEQKVQDEQEQKAPAPQQGAQEQQQQ